MSACSCAIISTVTIIRYQIRSAGTLIRVEASTRNGLPVASGTPWRPTPRRSQSDAQPSERIASRRGPRCSHSLSQQGARSHRCDESGLKNEYRLAVLDAVREGTAEVFTDPLASPTGFPFKVANAGGSLAEPGVYEDRKRVCDLGFLREAYRRVDGVVAFRCPAEPVDAYVAKGGSEDRTEGRKCLCNALIANIGHAQRRGERAELPLITAGDDLCQLARFIAPGQSTYSARDVITQILA